VKRRIPDANVSYREAIEAARGFEVDYVQLIKDYGGQWVRRWQPDGPPQQHKRRRGN